MGEGGGEGQFRAAILDLHKFPKLGTPKQGIAFENFTPKQGE